MEKTQEITAKEIVAEVKEEAKEAPSRIRDKLRRFEYTLERAATQFNQGPKN